MAYSITTDYVKKIVGGDLVVHVEAEAGGIIHALVMTEGEYAARAYSTRLASIHVEENTAIQLFSPGMLPATAISLVNPMSGEGADSSTLVSQAIAICLSHLFILRMSEMESIANLPVKILSQSGSVSGISTLQALNDALYIHLSPAAWMRVVPVNYGWYYETSGSENKRKCRTTKTRLPVQYQYVFALASEDNGVVPCRASLRDDFGSFPFLNADNDTDYILPYITESLMQGTSDEGFGRRKMPVGVTPGYHDGLRNIDSPVFCAMQDGKSPWPGDNRCVAIDRGRDDTVRFGRSCLGRQTDFEYEGYRSHESFDSKAHGSELAELDGLLEPHVGIGQMWATAITASLCQILGADVISRLNDYIDGETSQTITTAIMADAYVPLLLAAWVPEGDTYVPQTYIDIEANGLNPNTETESTEPRESYRRFAKRHSSGSSGSVHQQVNGFVIRYTADPTVWGASSLNRDVVMSLQTDQASIDELNADGISLHQSNYPEAAETSDSNHHSWKWGMTKAYGLILQHYTNTEYDVAEDVLLDIPTAGILLPFGKGKRNKLATQTIWATLQSYIIDTKIKRLHRKTWPTALAVYNMTKDRKVRPVPKQVFLSPSGGMTGGGSYLLSVNNSKSKPRRALRGWGGYYV